MVHLIVHVTKFSFEAQHNMPQPLKFFSDTRYVKYRIHRIVSKFIFFESFTEIPEYPYSSYYNDRLKITNYIGVTK